MVRSNHKQCPECGSFDTERVYQEDFTDMIEQVRICNDCPVQFTNQFFFEATEVEVLDE